MNNKHFYTLKDYTIKQLPKESRDLNELDTLAKASQEGLPLTAMHIIDPEIETNFYKLNNLPEQLSQLFRDVDVRNPDEDDIEEIAPRAQELLQKSYLLDEVIDHFYASLETAPDWLCIRYPYPHTQDAHHKVLRGRPSLMRLKELWRSRWSYDVLWKRLEATQSIALPAYPIIMHAPIVTEDDQYSQTIRDILQRDARVFVDDAGKIVHIAS